MSDDNDNIKFFPGVTAESFEDIGKPVSIESVLEGIAEVADDYKSIVFILKAKDGSLAVGGNTEYGLALAMLNRAEAELTDIVLDNDTE